METKRTLGARSSVFVNWSALAVMAAGAIAAAIFHQEDICAFLAALFLFCLVSRLWGERSLRNVSVEVEGTPERIFPPGKVLLTFRIRNKKALPVIWLDLADLLEESAPLFPADESVVRRLSPERALAEGFHIPYSSFFLRKKFTFLMGWEDLRWEGVWNARHRGIFRFSSLRIRAGDGFGLTQTERRLTDVGTRCIAVYPRVQPVNAGMFLRNLWDASSAAKGYLEDPTITRSTRPYARTDSFKQINWRITARTQQTTVNTYETILPKSAFFLVDGESFNGPGRNGEDFEDMLSILTSLLLRLDDAGVRCSVSLPQGRGTPPQDFAGHDRTPLKEILFALAGYELCGLAPPPDGVGEPLARPSVFHDSRILSFPAAGRFYYLCSRLDRVDPKRLLSRLDPARTVLLPYTRAAEPEPLEALYSVVCLCSLKGGKPGADA